MADNRSRLINEAVARVNAGDARGGAEILRSIAGSGKADATTLYELGRAEALYADFESAQQHLERAVRLRPREAVYHAQLAMARMQAACLDDALSAADRAIALDPSHPDAVRCKAEILRLSGRAADAFALLDPFVRSGRADAATEIAYARLCARFADADDGRRRLEAIAQQPGVTKVLRVQAMYALGEILDASGRFDRAFEWFERANTLEQRAFDLAAQARLFDEVMNVWSADAWKAMPRAGATHDEPVFIVGMPRSGTSLVEQIIASHPSAFGGGERRELTQAARNLLAPTKGGRTYHDAVRTLSPAALDRCARNLVRGMKKDAPAAARITDKAPMNFIHIGLIGLLFPPGRVIHCVRDPQDTCLSCYFHSFAGAYPFCTDLRNLGGFYRQYERLVRHWKSATDVPILDVQYESLVDDQEAQSRRIIEFLGLEWDDACLQFHQTDRVVLTESSEQVRRPMYKSSVNRREQYADHVEPLREALGV